MSAAAWRKVTNVVKTRNVMMLAMFAAVSFPVMVFNFPVRTERRPMRSAG